MTPYELAFGDSGEEKLPNRKKTSPAQIQALAL